MIFSLISFGQTKEQISNHIVIMGYATAFSIANELISHKGNYQVPMPFKIIGVGVVSGACVSLVRKNKKYKTPTWK